MTSVSKCKCETKSHVPNSKRIYIFLAIAKLAKNEHTRSIPRYYVEKFLTVTRLYKKYHESFMKYILNIANVKNELIYTIRYCMEKRCGKMKLTSLKNNEKIFSFFFNINNRLIRLCGL